MEIDLPVAASIEELVSRAKMHDAEAFAELIRRFEGIALSIAYASLRNAADAGDVVQDAFLRAWQRIDFHRRRRPGLLEGDVASNRAGVSASMEASEQRAQIDQALASLDELSRSCVMLRYFENLSSKEIGDVLHLSAAAVDMRLSRARTQLRDALGRTILDLA
jgi:DNA-directed RNA polymerase specialized sigma24 family protein